jgi:hypothetical protein
MTLTCSMLIAATLATGAPDARSLGPGNPPQAPSLATTVPAQWPARHAKPIRVTAPAPTVDAWMTDPRDRRPAVLPAMYASLGALQVMDVYSTRGALGAGASEANPLMQKAAGSSGTMLAMKALSTAGTIYFAERAWKKNRKGAIAVMAVVNGVTAAIAARNVRNAQR